MTSKKIKSKQDKLVQFMEDLNSKKNVFTEALKNENDTHIQNTKCYDQIRIDISVQFDKIIEEVTSLRDEKFTKLSTLQEQENQRHSEALTSIQSTTQVLSSAVELIQAGIGSGNPITMETTENNARHSVKDVDVPPTPKKVITKYKPGNINHAAMLPLFGDMIIEDQEVRPKQQHPPKPSKPQPTDVVQRKIDINEVRVQSTIQVRDKKYSIRVIVPITQDTAWVAAYPDKQLTMINRDGATVRTSVQVGDIRSNSCIVDAKKYNKDLLVTCGNQHQVIRLSEDGGTKTTFSDVSPFIPLGLCVTHVMEVLLCLGSTLQSRDQITKVIRINSNGDTTQSIQHDANGDAIYSWSYSVTSLQSGEVIVCDRGQHMRVSCVNSEGHLMFTWNGAVQGTKMDKFDPTFVTHDKYNNLFITDWNNHKVFVLSVDGAEAKCLIDGTQGIQNPYALAVNDQGQLWVGCDGGTIHIIEY